jgi:hypothetical protein
VREIEYLILAGATHVDAPNIGSDVLDVIDAFAARFLALPNEHARHTHVLWCAHCWFGVPPTFRTADQIRSDPERMMGIVREIYEIQA